MNSIRAVERRTRRARLGRRIVGTALGAHRRLDQLLHGRLPEECRWRFAFANHYGFVAYSMTMDILECHYSTLTNANVSYSNRVRIAPFILHGGVVHTIALAHDEHFGFTTKIYINAQLLRRT